MTRDAAKGPEQIERAVRHRGRPDIAYDFYGSAMAAAEAIVLEYAGEVQGLDKEVALLRTKLRSLLEGEDEEEKLDMKLFVSALDQLRKMLATRYQLSREAQEAMAGHIAALISEVGGQFFPEGRHGA